MTPMMKPCPCCGAPMTAEVGNIEYPAMYYRAIVRMVKLGRFFACWSCEHCEEA